MLTHRKFNELYAQEISEFNHFIKSRVVKKLCFRYDLHSVYLTHEGHVYTRGYNSHGQLGLGDQRDRYRKDGQIMPLRVPDLENIIDIHTGCHETFCRDKNLRVYAWGCNNHGQLGLGHHHDTLKPELVEALADRRIVSIENNACVAYFLDDEGCVYSCGYFGSSASTGLGEWVTTYPDNNPINTPTRILGLPPIKTICPLGDHVFFLSADGEVFGCGRNLNGQLGVGDNITRYTPVRLNLPPVKQIDGNWEASFFLTEDGRVFACGQDKVKSISIGLNESERRDNDYYHLVHLTNIREPIIKMQPCGFCGIFITESHGVYIHYRKFDHHANDTDISRVSEITDFCHIAIPVPLEVDMTCTNKYSIFECLYQTKSYYWFGPGSETAILCHRKLGIPLPLKLLTCLSFLNPRQNKINIGDMAIATDLTEYVDGINQSRENEKALNLGQ